MNRWRPRACVLIIAASPSRGNSDTRCQVLLSRPNLRSLSPDQSSVRFLCVSRIFQRPGYMLSLATGYDESYIVKKLQGLSVLSRHYDACYLRADATCSFRTQVGWVKPSVHLLRVTDVMPSVKKSITYRTGTGNSLTNAP